LVQSIIQRARLGTSWSWTPLVALGLEALALVALGKLAMGRGSAARRERQHDLVDERSDQSFPASDPPALTAGRGS
jgi:hypothetical protein